MYCFYCSVARPHGAVVWSVVYDCGIPDHTHFFIKNKKNNEKPHVVRREMLCSVKIASSCYVMSHLEIAFKK